MTLLLISFVSNAQKKIVKEQYCKQVDARGYDGNYSAYVVKLFTDSTIEFQIYFIEGVRYNAPLYRTTYFGKYYQGKDTLIIPSLTGYTGKYDKGKNEHTKSVIGAKEIFFKLPASLFVANKTISSPSFLFPPLGKADDIEVNAIEILFEVRNKSVK
ncbi:MAG: hypothetical protein SGI83_12590 [Bacteroidota bacterium]|nr:hypothetical protein [Bacteroidota bacterium]